MSVLARRIARSASQVMRQSRLLAKAAKPEMDYEEFEPQFEEMRPAQSDDVVVEVDEVSSDFTAQAVVNGEIEPLSLSNFEGKWVVLFFYPLDFTFVCPTEILEFSAKANEFEEVNAQVLGISVDSVYSHLAWQKTDKSEGGLGGYLNFPLLSDLDRSISESFGALREEGFTNRTTVIIDPEGVVKHLSTNAPEVGRNVDEVLRLVKAYQHAAEHGEVCPAGWKDSGDKTIVPNPEDAKEYFSTM
ncbi:MAG: hypothetical protein MHM6MM_001646 [Cercozoa sp. M6MM]